MINHELTKREKKIAREIIDNGLIAEFENGLENFGKTIDKWKSKKLGTKESYYELYKKITSFDKKIGRRYDGITGGRYLTKVIEILADDLVDKEIIGQFEPKTQAIINLILERKS